MHLLSSGSTGRSIKYFRLGRLSINCFLAALVDLRKGQSERERESKEGIENREQRVEGESDRGLEEISRD